MRWQLGDYIVKYNPKTNSKSWQADQDIIMNVNGQISNPNLIFKGTQNFVIDVFEKPTYSTPSVLSGSASYIGASEKRVNEYMYLLKSGGVFDVRKKDNTLIGTYTIVSGNGFTVPVIRPQSISHYDSGVAFISSDGNSSNLLMTDENGVINRKYTYSTDDLKYGEEIIWDYGTNFLALNPYGKIYKVTMTGTSSFLYQFDDYDSNFSSSYKKYTSIMMTTKNNKPYIGVLQDKKDIVYIDYSTLEISCKAETGLFNVIDICNSNYSGDSFAVMSNKINKLYPNTSRLDIEYLKTVVCSGEITVYDEYSVPTVLVIKDMSVSRQENKNESRYEVEFSADIGYTNMGFSGTWFNVGFKPPHKFV
jgi:hypothetical protein